MSFPAHPRRPFFSNLTPAVLTLSSAFLLLSCDASFSLQGPVQIAGPLFRVLWLWPRQVIIPFFPEPSLFSLSPSMWSLSTIVFCFVFWSFWLWIFCVYISQLHHVASYWYMVSLQLMIDVSCKHEYMNINVTPLVNSIIGINYMWDKCDNLETAIPFVNYINILHIITIYITLYKIIYYILTLI